MGTSLLASTDIQEALSIAYVQALAASLGYATAKRDFDRDGIDLTIEAGGDQRPKIDMQLKATINIRKTKTGHLRFSIPLRNYNLLRIATQTPRLLVVYNMPRDPNEWCVLSHSSMLLKRRAYWINLKGMPPPQNGTSVTMDIPNVNLLDTASLDTLMDCSRAGTL